jgi:hypothetical protein
MGMTVCQPQHEQKVFLGHGQLRSFTPGENPCQQPEDFVDRREDQVEDVENGDYPARDHFRVTLGEGLGGDLAKDQDAESHQTDHHRQPAVGRKTVGNLGRQGGSEHVDKVVADQDGDQQLLGS